MTLTPDPAAATSGAPDPTVIYGSLALTPTAATVRSYAARDAPGLTRRLTLRNRRCLTVQPGR